LFSDYEPGDIAYIGNGFSNNGVVGYVTPLKTDRVFNFRAVVVSAFCEVTVNFPHLCNVIKLAVERKEEATALNC
jgi:hypothetical protein